MEPASFCVSALSGRATPVKLRNENRTYMVADVNKRTVRQSHHGSSPNAKWFIETVEGKPKVIRLKSCSGQCLTATYCNKDWELICNDGVPVKLKTWPDHNSTSPHQKEKLKTDKGIFWYVEVLSPSGAGTNSGANKSLPSASSASPLQRNAPVRSSSSGKSNHCLQRNLHVNASPSAPKASVLQRNSPVRLGANKSSSSVHRSPVNSSKGSPLQRNSPVRSRVNNHQRNSPVKSGAHPSPSAPRASLLQRNSPVRSLPNTSSSLAESNLCSKPNFPVKSPAKASPSAPRASPLQRNSPVRSRANEYSTSGKSNHCSQRNSPSASRPSLLQRNSPVRSLANKPASSGKSNICLQHNSPVKSRANASSAPRKSNLPHRNSPQTATAKKPRS